MVTQHEGVDDEKWLGIGQVAEATGAAASALRYYEEIGLVQVASRVGGKRRFAPDVVGRVNFIRRAKDAGFSLSDVGEILDDTSGSWRSIVGAKRVELVEKRNRLDQLIGVLDEIGDCGCSVVVDCPLLLEA